jgi:hypothetical protein
MHIKFTNGTDKHLDRDVAQGFIEAGVAIALPNKRETCLEAQIRMAGVNGDKRTKPNTVWNVRPAQTVNEFSYGPEIHSRCQSCNVSFRASNETKTITSVFRHAGSCAFAVEAVPAAILKEYEAARDEFHSKRGRAAQTAEEQKQKNENAKKLFLQSMGGR